VSELTVYARRMDGTLDGQVDAFNRVELTSRLLDPGTYTLKGVPHAIAAAYGMLDPLAGVQFVRDGVTVLSGPITEANRRYNPDTDTWDFAGADDKIILQWRVAHPQPGSSTPPYSTTAYDVSTGPASTVLRHYVDVNAGPGAIARRRFPGLTLAADPAIGLPIAFGARWQSLLYIVQWAAKLGDLAFDIVGLQLQIRQPADLTGSIIFSTDLGNMAEFTMATSAPDVNYVYALAGGEGTARTVREGQDSTSIAAWGLIEGTVDRRDTTDPTEIDNEITRELTDKAARTAVTLKPIDLSQMTFGVHYNLGDKVTAIIDDTIVKDRIREVRFVRDAGTDTVEPGIGNADTLAAMRKPKIKRDFAELARRTTALETI
jgi:hypothetical protein